MSALPRRAAYTLGTTLALASSVALAAERPAPLADEDGCRHYRGTASGNDPSVQLDVIVCPHPDGTPGKVRGKVQWSSLLSGWNLRQVEGQWSMAKLAMHDTAILEERPESGFMFCTIDAYQLDVMPDGRLVGSYESAACRDSARLELAPNTAPGGVAGGVVRPDATGAAPEADPPPAPPSSPETTAPAATTASPATPAPTGVDTPGTAEPEPTGGCGCTVLAFVPLIGTRRRRRRPTAVRAAPAQALRPT